MTVTRSIRVLLAAMLGIVLLASPAAALSDAESDDGEPAAQVCVNTSLGDGCCETVGLSVNCWWVTNDGDLYACGLSVKGLWCTD